jgi:gliding motility-associated-like protein
VINAATGDIDLVASTPGTYTITYSFTIGGCSNTTTTSITITALPVATITYSGSPYCATGTATVTQTGTAGGTYSAPAGVVINAATGDIDLVASTPGTYSITYSFTSGGCNNTTTTSITINALPTATINYAGSPYCATGTATVTQTGTAGGTYSAPAGVVINAATGDINLLSSTPGIYTITYTFSNGVCINTATAPITINALPTAVIVYTGNPYCAIGLANATQIGQTGGTYSAPAGVVINATTGGINLTASTPGTYLVAYNFSNGTCSNSTTTNVTINAQPVASIAYTGTPYCTNGTAVVSLTGIGGGSYSSTAGLSLNPVTGDINLATSLEGTYSIFYNFTNGTCSNTTSTTITIKNPTLIVNNPPAVCAPETIDLTNPSVTAGSQPGLTYNYYQDIAGTILIGNPASVGTTGTYYIKGTNLSNGCSSNIQPALVTINPKPPISAAASETDVCKGTTITLNALSPGNTIDWPGIGTGNVVTVTPLDSTTYLAVATTTLGCKDTTTVDVAVKPFRLTLTANPDPVLAGTNTTFTTGGNFTYNVLSWSPDIFFADQTATSQNIVVKDTSKSFTVIAQSTDGCLDTAKLFVNVDVNMKDFFIPNSFSPNNDGLNDLFKVYGSSVRDLTMRVYNQWGELIFETNNAQGGWDGTWKGRPQAIGVYVYVAKVTFYNNVSVIRKGTINLIR